MPFDGQANTGHRPCLRRGNGDVLDIGDTQHLLQRSPRDKGNVRLLLVYDRPDDADDFEAPVIDLDVLANRIHSRPEQLIPQRRPDHRHLPGRLDI